MQSLQPQPQDFTAAEEGVAGNLQAETSVWPTEEVMHI
jgi:hypothetical protein